MKCLLSIQFGKTKYNRNQQQLGFLMQYLVNTGQITRDNYLQRKDKIDIECYILQGKKHFQNKTCIRSHPKIHHNQYFHISAI